MTQSGAPQQPPNNAGSKKPAANMPTEKDTKVHIPAFMPFFWLGLAAIAGSLLADWLKFGWEIWLVGSILSLVLLILSPREKPLRKLPAGLLIMVCCLTGMLYRLSLPGDSAADISHYIGEGVVSFTGVVSEPPEN